jgi:hypothetical protein
MGVTLERRFGAVSEESRCGNRFLNRLKFYTDVCAEGVPLSNSSSIGDRRTEFQQALIESAKKELRAWLKTSEGVGHLDEFVAMTATFAAGRFRGESWRR